MGNPLISLPFQTARPDGPIRRITRKFILAAALLVASLPIHHSYAGVDASKHLLVAATEVDPFAKGMRELDLTSGVFFSPVIATGGRPTFNYVQGDLFFGWMLTSPETPWGLECMRGNWELLLNGFGCGVTTGPGNYLAGGRLLVRYNFVRPAAKWVPFFQLGGGGLLNDAYKDQSQHLIGGQFEFTLVADLGLRYFLSPKCALVLAADFEHISNAGTASRNLGVNAAGATLGVGFFF